MWNEEFPSPFLSPRWGEGRGEGKKESPYSHLLPCEGEGRDEEEPSYAWAERCALSAEPGVLSQEGSAHDQTGATGPSAAGRGSHHGSDGGGSGGGAGSRAVC